MSQQTGTLRSQIKTSATLSGLSFASNVGLRLVSTIVLTRLLAPDVYGVFAIVLAYMLLLNMLSDLGLRSLILTREGVVTEKFLRTCWTVSILRGVVILVFSGLIALVLAVLQSHGSFALDTPYAASVLPWAMLALGAAALVFGFESPNRFMREREMAFGAVTLVDLTRNLVTLIVTIALAYYLRSVWALVIGNAVRSGLHVVLSFAVFRGPKMGLLLDRPSLQVLITRGKWVLSQSGLAVLSMAADRILLGFVMSSATFGFYYIARQLVDMATEFLMKMNGQMGLQVFSRLHQQSLPEFRRKYYRYRLVFDLLAGLIAGAALVLAPMIIDIVFDERYQGIVPIFQILILSILLMPMVLMRSMFNAERNFRVTTLVILVSTIVLWVGLGMAIFVFDSVFAGLFVIALYRIPEAVILIFLARSKGRVSMRREPFVFGFFGAGAAIGWLIVQAWEFLA